MTTSFGTYELLERIGKGGMAEVYLARSVGAEGLEKRLVIKKILPHLASSDRFVEMFIQEAKIAMGLNHPNIVQVYDFGKVGQDYYLAMEYVEGVELSRLLEASRQLDEPMPVGDAVHVAVEVARGLDYIHRRKSPSGKHLELVHRDISPQNLMISWDGAVKIVDFGISSSAPDSEAQKGELRGKYRYMSPEEARGEGVDARSDLFSLGAVLFEMLCGRQLFSGEKPREILQLIESAVVPDIAALNPELPERLEHVMYKVLSAQPDRRFEDARSFQVELTRVLYDMDQIHDGTTLGQFITSVDDQLSETSSGLHPTDPGTRSPSERTAPSFPSNKTGGLTTPALEDSAIDERGRPEVTRQMKAVSIIAGRFQGDDQRAQRQLRHLVESISYKNDAVVDQLGDGTFTLLVGIPVADETDPQRAVQMALELQEALSSRSTGFGDSLQLKIGVAAGEVIFFQNLDSPTRAFEWQLQSAYSRRVEALLEGGGQSDHVVCDSGIYRQVRRTFDCERVDGDGDHTCYRIRGEKTPSTQIRELRQSLEAFYGRDIARRQLRNHLRQTVVERRARALIFVGAPGVGKSTLVEEFLQGLDRRDVRVVRGVASPVQRDVPLASAAALLAELLELDLDAPESKITGQLQKVIGHLFANASQEEREWLVDSLSRIFAIGTCPGQQEDSAGGAGEQRRHIFAAIRRLMNRFARGERPLVLAIDDIHNIDPVMMAFTAEYFDRSQRVPVLFVATGRDTGPHVETRPWRELTEARNVEIEQLEELPEPQARRMVRGLLLSHGSDNEDLVELVVEQAGGNPLHIREVVDTLVEHGAVGATGDRGGDGRGTEELLAPSLEGLIRARIDRLDVEHREVLKTVSLLPIPFSAQRAASVCERDVSMILDELVAEDMLQHVDTDDEHSRYRFAGAVTREVARRRLTPDQARGLHGKIADMLLEQRERADSALIARHLDAADRSEEALQLYEEAVQRAFRQFGAEECLRLCDRIIDHPDVDESRRFRTLMWRCRAQERLGAHDDARQTLELLEELAPRVGQPHEQVQVILRRARLHIDRGDYAAARQCLEQALDVAREHDASLEMVHAWRLEAVIELSEGDRDRALSLIDRAIATLNIGEGQRAREAMIEAYNARGVILRQSGRHREALEAYDTALAATGGVESSNLERQLLLNSGLALAYLGEFSEAKCRYKQSLEGARRLGYRRDEALVLVNLGHLYEILGRYEKATRSVRRGIVLARRTDAIQIVADGEITMGLVRLRVGELDAADRHLEEGLKLARSLPNTYLITCARLGQCEVELERGDATSVQRAVDRGRKILQDCEEAGMMWGIVVAHGLLAKGLSELGQLDEALEHSRNAVDMLDEVKLLGVTHVLVTHLELLQQTDADQEQRHRYIRQAHEIYQKRLNAIDDEKDRRAFAGLEVNQKIRQMVDELSTSSQAPSVTE